jgi:hypothetical protein
MKPLIIKHFVGLSLISVLLLSCSHKPKEAKTESATEEENILYGSWTNKTGGEKLFTLKKDTIIFQEEGESVARRYYINKDTLGISYGNYIGKSIIIKSVKDTLILSSEGEKTTYIRFREIQ